MKSKFVLGLLFISAIFSFSIGQIQPDKIQTNALQVLKTKYNNSIHIDWDKRNGSPEIITFSNPTYYDKDPENSAKLFLKEVTDLMKYRVKKDTLVIIKRNENKGRKNFHYQQKYGGIPVKGGEYVVTVLNDGKIQTALGSFYKDISINTKPNILPAEALSIALKNQPKGIELKIHLRIANCSSIPKTEITVLCMNYKSGQNVMTKHGVISLMLYPVKC